ncbi:ABC transporter ATP-binding protein [Hydrogenophaga sp.]|jgi:branched-chain amino acid transport system ATP-binding protein|uniref:ABC transporter ATP-binding protein n=1 Tax=Hydrogenophaga sp. TaxID=1904254 RepID=UPI003F715845
MSELLVLDRVTAGYGASVVLEDVSVSLAAGGSLALLGRNGVGKSTLLLTLMGFTALHGGAVHWQGRDLQRVLPHERVRAGIGWVPQDRLMFPSLSVAEHLQVAARPGEWDIPRVYQLFPRLAERRRNMGNQLSGGEQQMLAIARALMTNPRVLLLDEPMEGLAPLIVQELLGVLRRLVSDSGLSVIVVEQHARLALELTRQAVVLERGRVVHASDSASLLASPETLNRLIGVA